jgi:hypothetical protein
MEISARCRAREVVLRQQVLPLPVSLRRQQQFHGMQLPVQDLIRFGIVQQDRSPGFL